MYCQQTCYMYITAVFGLWFDRLVIMLLYQLIELMLWVLWVMIELEEIRHNLINLSFMIENAKCYL